MLYLNQHPKLRYVLYVLLLLPSFIFRDYTTSNELKYISIIEEAVANNTWFTYYYHGEIYADKPPLYFALVRLLRFMMGGCKLGCIGLLALLPAVGTLAVMDRWFKESGISYNPVVANLMLFTTSMFMGAALIVRMDMLMTFFITLSLYTFFRIYENRNRPAERYLLPVYVFLAIFSKGFLGFLIPLASVFFFLIVKGELRTFVRYWGWKQWGILTGLCTLWFVTVFLEGGTAYLNDLVIRQTVGRGINSFHHKEPVWFYFPRMLWSFGPWILLCLAVLFQAIRKQRFTTDTEKFFLTIVVTNLFLLSIISAKLDIYLLPIYPFAIYLCASLLAKSRKSRSIRIAIGIPAAIWALFFPLFVWIILPLSAWEEKIPYDLSGALPFLAISILSAGGIGALHALRKREIEHSVAYIGGSVFVAFFAAAFLLSRFNIYIGYREMAEAAMKRAGIEEITEFAYYRFDKGPDLDVYLKQPLSYIENVRQLDSLDNLPQKHILFVRGTEIRREEAFKEWLAPREAAWSIDRYSWYIVGGAVTALPPLLRE